MALSSSLQQLIILALCILPTVKMTGIMIPLYTDPTDDNDDWNTVLNIKKTYPDLPIVVVINPEDGPGSSDDTDYIKGIANFKSAGIIVVGYSPTGLGLRPRQQVMAEMDLYKKWYPQIDGFFFDEMGGAYDGYQLYYSNLTAYAKSNGFTVTFGNPGSLPLMSYMTTVDHVVVWEDYAMPKLSSFHKNVYSSVSAIIAHTQPTLNTTWIQAAVGQIGWIYISDQVAPQIYDNLPTYFALEAKVLNSANLNANTATSN